MQIVVEKCLPFVYVFEQMDLIIQVNIFHKWRANILECIQIWMAITFAQLLRPIHHFLGL